MRKKASPKMLPARAEPIPANQRPWWLGVPLLGRLMAIIFPQQHLRAVKRTQFIGTRALSSVMMARLELSRHARRGARLSSNERARILRARSPGLTAAKGMQHARDGRIRGVLKYPQRRAA